MAAGQGFKTFTTGEVLTAGDVNGYLMQGINVFATTTARDAAITAPAEGQFAFTKDTNGLWYYDGAAWVASGATGDIEGVTAGVGISGGGTSGTVTVTNSMATAIDAKGDLVPGTGADTFARLPVGADGTVLTADSAETTGIKWATPAAGMTNPMTTTGDTIYSSSGSTPARLGIGSTGQVLTVAAGIPSWATPSGSLANYAQIGSTTTLSGSSVTFSSISGKDSLFIYINNAKSSSSANIDIYFNGFGPADYTYSNVERAGTAACEFGGGIGDDEFTIGASGGSNSLRGLMTVFGAGSTGIKPVSFTGSIASGSNNLSRSGDGFYFGSSAITSVTIKCSAGSFNSGTVALYGA